jgi:hypothetical protein
MGRLEANGAGVPEPLMEFLDLFDQDDVWSRGEFGDGQWEPAFGDLSHKLWDVKRTHANQPGGGPAQGNINGLSRARRLIASDLTVPHQSRR